MKSPTLDTYGGSHSHPPKQQTIDYPNLDLRLSLNNSDESSLATCLPDDLSKSKMAVVSAYSNHNQTPAPRVFSCNYCRRHFYSSQALGGHQNAHRTERTIGKHRSPATIYSSLGVQVHSTMLHKPQNRSTFSQFSIARKPLGGQPAVARFLPPDIGGAGRFNDGLRYSLAGDVTDVTCCGDQFKLQKLDLSLKL